MPRAVMIVMDGVGDVLENGERHLVPARRVGGTGEQLPSLIRPGDVVGVGPEQGLGQTLLVERENLPLLRLDHVEREELVPLDDDRNLGGPDPRLRSDLAHATGGRHRGLARDDDVPEPAAHCYQMMGQFLSSEKPFRARMFGKRPTLGDLTQGGSPIWLAALPPYEMLIESQVK